MSEKASILGLGSSGEAAARLLHARGWEVTILNSTHSPAIQARSAALAKEGIHIITGPAADTDSTSYDLCVLSPGIAPTAPIVQNVQSKNIPVIGEIELAFRECPFPIIAITGTNGKTTTTGLVETLLNGCGMQARACGNIGLPFSEVVRHYGASDLQIMVVETSSFQLETIYEFHPHIAVWLNLSPNHLDRYSSVEEYREAKLRIFLNQDSVDFAVVNARDKLPPLAAEQITFSAYENSADFTLHDSQILFRNTPVLDQRNTHVPGIHNAENLMAALAVGYCLDLEFTDMAKAIAQYTPPEHRCELVQECNGVRWVNDSKCTNLDALEKAICSQSGPLILIAGGKDKGFEFDLIADLVTEKVKTVILIGEMRHRIAASWHSTPSKICDTLEAAIRLAADISRPGDTVLFSPGTSSYDMFVNYEERGNCFKKLVHSLQNQTS